MNRNAPLRSALLLGTALAVGLSAAAAGDKADDPYALSAEETYEIVQEKGDEVLFLDVRDPVELMFTGATNEVDANIPFLLMDRDRQRDNGMFAMPRNPRFTEEVAAALEAKGLPRDARIITMCRSGSSRGRPSAEYLRENGFPNTFYVRNGFQGGKLAGGMRSKNGWQNEGLPWTWSIDGDKVYRVTQ